MKKFNNFYNAIIENKLNESKGINFRQYLLDTMEYSQLQKKYANAVYTPQGLFFEILHYLSLAAKKSKTDYVYELTGAEVEDVWDDLPNGKVSEADFIKVLSPLGKGLIDLLKKEGFKISVANKKGNAWPKMKISI